MKDKSLKKTNHEPEVNDYVTVIVGGQLIGIPILRVRDILVQQRITRIPLAPKEIVGALNLRGRIVTVIDLRVKFDLLTLEDSTKSMNIVIEYKDELYSLMVDEVGEVLSLNERDREPNPGTLDAHWQELSLGVYQLKDRLLIRLDVDRLFTNSETVAA